MKKSSIIATSIKLSTIEVFRNFKLSFFGFFWEKRKRFFNFLNIFPKKDLFLLRRKTNDFEKSPFIIEL